MIYLLYQFNQFKTDIFTMKKIISYDTIRLENY